MKTKRIVIVQCRLSSTRLPGKALKELDGKPVLAWVLNSMKKIKADKYYVATDADSFQMLKPICQKYDFDIFAGDLNDVLKRFCDLLKTVKAETVIRATADNPFLFYEAANASVEDFEERNKGKNRCDYLTYSGLPHGSGVEIFSVKSLLEAAEQTDDPYDHEHVGPALYNHKDKFVCEFVKAPLRFNYPNLRTTIDTQSDFMRAISIVNYLSSVSKPAEDSGKKSKNKEWEPYTTEQILEACNSEYVQNPIVYVPSVIKGQGTGHLHRCLAAALESKSFVYIPSDYSLVETENIVQEYKEKGLLDYQIISELPDETLNPVIVTDGFSLTEQKMKEYRQCKKLISIDEGSDYTDYCDYLLDIIPSYDCKHIPNKFDTSYIIKPQNVRSDKSRNIEDVLVCIGGEDPAGLTLPAAQALTKLLPGAHIKAVVSDIEKYKNILNIEFVSPIENLREKIYQYDLVVTHYGLTAFEAMFAGCAVIMVATSKLHEKLAQKYDFAYLPFDKIDAKKMQNALESENLYPENKMSVEQKSLGECIKKLSYGKRLLCPVCQKQYEKPDSIISRNATRTYRRCNNCGLVYMSFTSEEDKKYEKSYFFEDYKKQYGKTYTEDFDSIKNQCLKRIENIKLLHQNKSSINYLDIGCAYGPFLSAAADYGLNPFGTDISEDAISYVQNKLKIPSVTSAFPSIDIEQEFGLDQFDIVTMWYVIEHFKNLDSVLRKVCKIVKTGGIFAFSTPSGEGISARSNKDHFYNISPTDHYSVWEPTRAAGVLQKYGFKVEKIVSTGHHPERFPYIKKNNIKSGSIKWKIVDKISHAKKLGDTMEIYCRKIW